MKNKKEIKISFGVTSTEGHSDFELLPKEALAKIRELEAESEKWVFVGTDHVKSETLTEDKLVEATTEGLDIMLVTALAGGCDVATEKVIKIEVDTVKDKKGILINFESNEYEKKVVIGIGKDNYIDLLHDREVIFRALKRKLENMAISEVEGMAKALNVR